MPCLYCMYAYSCRPNISTSPSEKRKTGPNLTLNMCLVIYGGLEFSKIDENLLIYGISVVCTLGTKYTEISLSFLFSLTVKDTKLLCPHGHPARKQIGQWLFFKLTLFS